MKPYIERNTDLQREAEKKGNKIKKQNAKLRNNPIFDKSKENLMNKVDLKILTTRKHLKWSFRLNFKRDKQFHNGAIAIDKEKCKTNLRLKY